MKTRSTEAQLYHLKFTLKSKNPTLKSWVWHLRFQKCLRYQILDDKTVQRTSRSVFKQHGDMVNKVKLSVVCE